MSAPVRQLICEGRCNDDTVRAFDRAVAVTVKTRILDREDGERGQVVVPIEDALAAVLRTQQHTVHARVFGGDWRCTRCGEVRR